MISILIYLSAVLYVYSQFCEAKVDGWTWDNLYSDKITYKMKKDQWHLWKTIGKISFLLSIFIKGYLATEVPFLEIFFRFGFESLIAWAVWHQTYYFTRYGSIWNTENAANIIYIPGLKDKFISLTGKKVWLFHIVRYAVGILGIIFIERL